MRILRTVSPLRMPECGLSPEYPVGDLRVHSFQGDM